MRFIRTKAFIAVLFVLLSLYFSNDYGLIDIEKTAIVTAIAIDKSQDSEEYQVTAQIAVPEATDTNEENKKAVLTGKGGTVGGAIKDLGNVSGWFPKLSFCNLIILGSGLKDQNVIQTLDYFVKTLRVQDSALVTMAENTAKEILEATSPLDNISAFAVQKILLKNPGFDKDVITIDIREFCSDYYEDASSSLMPIIKLSTERITGDDKDQASSGGSSATQGGGGNVGSQTEGKGDTLFDATTTALFVKGKVVGTLDRDLTRMYNMMTSDTPQNTIAVNGVDSEIGGANHLLTVIRNTPQIKLDADQNNLNLTLSLNLYCRIADCNTTTSDLTFMSNVPMPLAVKEKTEQQLLEQVAKLYQAQVDTGCDFLGIKKMLYRYHFKDYARYKDNYLTIAKPTFKVTVSGQK